MGFGGFLKKSTAIDILIGPFVDNTDGDTEETALTIAQADVRLSKNGQVGAQKSDVTAAAHDADGFYNCELDAIDTNTVGQLTAYVHVSGALAVRHDYHVVAESIYDALFGASASGFDSNARVDVGSWLGTVPNFLVNSRMDSDIGAKTGNVALSAQEKLDVNTEADTALTDYDAVIPADLNDPTAAAIADQVWNEAQVDHATAGSFGEIATEIAAIPTTAMRGTDNVVLSGPTKAEMDTAHALLATEAKQDIIDTNVDDIETAVITNAAGVDIAADIIAIKAETVLIVADTNELQTDDVPGLIAALNDAPAVSAVAISDTVWDEAQADHVAAGSFGVTASEIAALQTDLDNATDGLGALKTLIDAIQTDLDNGTDGLGALKALIDGLNDISTANVNTEVDTAWTTQIADSVPADGTIPTREQMLYMLGQFVMDFAISDTTRTTRKVDGSTALMTHTLDDDTNPTALTRAT